MQLMPSFEKHETARCLMPVWPSTRLYSWSILKFNLRNPLSSSMLPSCLMTTHKLLIQDYLKVTMVVQRIHPDLTDIPLKEPKTVLYRDESSFIKDGTKYTGATLTGTVWAQALGSGTSTQRAELITLTQAFTIYTVTMLLLLCKSTEWSIEKEDFSPLGERH